MYLLFQPYFAIDAAVLLVLIWLYFLLFQPYFAIVAAVLLVLIWFYFLLVSMLVLTLRLF